VDAFVVVDGSEDRDGARRAAVGLGLGIHPRRLALSALAAQRFEEVGRVGNVLWLAFGLRLLLLERLLVERRGILVLIEDIEGTEAGDEPLQDLALARELRRVVVPRRDGATARIVRPARVALDAASGEGELDDPAVIGLPAGPPLGHRREVG